MTDYFELFDQKKDQRPICGSHDNDWKHIMITYESENRKECSYCGYWEEIAVPMDDYDHE